MDGEYLVSDNDVLKDEIKNDIKDVIIEQKNTNPWHMTSISDFLYYCCIECGFKDRNEEKFIGHATAEHPKSREIFENNQTFVESEKIEENSNDESTNEDIKSDTDCDNLDDKKEVFYEVISQVVGDVRFKCRFCDYKRFINISRSFIHKLFIC